jgi:hypothetical protein
MKRASRPEKGPLDEWDVVKIVFAVLGALLGLSYFLAQLIA